VTEGFRSFRAELPAPVEELVASLHDAFTQIELLRVLLAAPWFEPVLVDAEVAARMVRPYSWLLDRVGTGGIKLTAAGYLPPVHVTAAVADPGLEEEWIGSYNREDQTLPVLELRESAMRLGLLRKSSGKLIATPRGREVRGDPTAMWWSLAENLPPQRAVRQARHAGLLLLAAAAGGIEGDPFDFVTRMLVQAGWAFRDGRELSRWDARNTAVETYTVLHRLGALTSAPHSPGPEHPTPDGALFARAALRTWSAQSAVMTAIRRTSHARGQPRMAA
jgi:hypothetical protein